MDLRACVALTNHSSKLSRRRIIPNKSPEQIQIFLLTDFEDRILEMKSSFLN